MKTIKHLFTLALLSCSAVSFVACESLDDSITSDPYGGGKEPIGIKLLAQAPVPEKAYPGDTVVFAAKGLQNLFNSSTGEYGFKFYMNEVETAVESATDSTLTVIVPANVNSGLTYIVAQNQVFYGPRFTVLGNLAIDNDYKLSSNKFQGAVYDYLESKYSGSANTFYLVGGFIYAYNANNNLFNYGGFAFCNEQGTLANESSSNYSTSRGIVTSVNDTDPHIRSISYFNDGQMLISGSFSAVYARNEYNPFFSSWSMPANNIAIVEKNGAPFCEQKKFNELTQNSDSRFDYVYLSKFNGGTNGPVIKSFVTKDQKVVAIGNFTEYSSTVYEEWFAQSHQTTTTVANVVRANRNGSIDDSYRNGQYTGAHGGVINDAIPDGEDGIIIVGTFTSFDGVPCNGIVRLDADGNVDNSFMTNIGQGANGEILKIRYNKNLNKAVVTGAFESFGGLKRHGLAVIDNAGNIDGDFIPREISGGGFDFATILDCGRIVAAGTFRIYDNVPRQGFVVLEPDGEALQRYNVPGEFSGELYQVVETQTSVGNYGLLLLGDLNRFNGEAVNNAVMLEANFED